MKIPLQGGPYDGKHLDVKRPLEIGRYLNIELTPIRPSQDENYLLGGDGIARHDPNQTGKQPVGALGFVFGEVRS